MPGTVLRIGTRGSRLALAQATIAADAIASARPGIPLETVVIRTTGDAVLDRPLHEVGGKGAFVKELERALLDHRVDLAVHSCKDVPATQPLIAADHLVLACFLPREDPSDVLVCRPARSLHDLPRGASVGTSSPRRVAWLRDVRDDLRVVVARGNIDTRLAKLHAGDCDALILAKAGLRRAGLLDPTWMRDLPPDVFVPAAGQGAIVLQCRANDRPTRELLATIDCPITRRCVELERAVVRELQGDCHSAIGVLAQPGQQGLRVLAAMATTSGVRRCSQCVPDDEPVGAIVAEIARRLR